MSKKIKDFKLNTLLESHNRWLSNEKSGRRANLDDHDLSNYTFNHKNFIGAMLNKCVFKNTNLINCDFNNSNMQEAEVDNSNFNDSDISRVNLRGTEIKNSSFTKVRAVKTNASYTEIHNTDLDFMTCVDVDFSYSLIKNCDIFKTVFTRCDFTGAKLESIKNVASATFDNCINLSPISEEVNFVGDLETLNGE